MGKREKNSLAKQIQKVKILTCNEHDSLLCRHKITLDVPLNLIEQLMIKKRYTKLTKVLLKVIAILDSVCCIAIVLINSTY